MPRTLNLAVGSTCSLPGDLAGNLDQIEQLAAQAGRMDSDLLLTPEMSATGYGGFPEVLALAEPAGDGPVYQRLARLARTYHLVLLAGFVERSGGRRFLGHYAVYPDGSFVVQRKQRVTPREYPLESPVDLYFDETEDIGHVRPGEEQFTFFDVKGVRCGVVICADLGVRTRNAVFSRAGVDLLLLPTGAGGTREERFETRQLLNEEGRQRYYQSMQPACFPGDGILECIRERRAMAAVNLCGYDGRVFYHGGQGSIVNCFGDVVGLLAGIPTIERARPRIAFGSIDFDEKLA